MEDNEVVITGATTPEERTIQRPGREPITHRVFFQSRQEAYPSIPLTGDVVLLRDDRHTVLAGWTGSLWMQLSPGGPEIAARLGGEPKARVLVQPPLEVNNRRKGDLWLSKETVKKRTQRGTPSDHRKRKAEDDVESEKVHRRKLGGEDLIPKIEDGCCAGNHYHDHVVSKESWTPPPGFAPEAGFLDIGPLRVPQPAFQVDGLYHLAAEDYSYMDKVAKLGRPAEEAPEFFQRYDDPTDPELPTKIARDLMHGKMVVVNGMPEGGVDRETFEFNVETAEKYFIGRNETIEVLDAVKRSDPKRKASGPHVNIKLKELFDTCSDPSVCFNCLKRVAMHGTTPSFIQRIDANWQFSSGKWGCEHIRKDRISLSMWILLAQAGFVTEGHFDGEGLCTWIRVMHQKGIKIWGIAVPPDSVAHESPAANVKRSAQCDSAYLQPPAAPKLYFIILQPGSVLIQPPGIWHFVFTPTPTMCFGGHFLPWHSMVRTEPARQVTADTRHACTNAEHKSVRHLISCMMANLSELQYPTRIPIATVKSLCRMALRPYVFAQWMSENEVKAVKGKKVGDQSVEFKFRGVKYIRDVDPDFTPQEEVLAHRGRSAAEKIMAAWGWTEAGLFREYEDPNHKPDFEEVDVVTIKNGPPKVIIRVPPIIQQSTASALSPTSTLTSLDSDGGA